MTEAVLKMDGTMPDSRDELIMSTMRGHMASREDFTRVYDFPALQTQKKNCVGASIREALRKRELTRAPCAVTPNRLAEIALLLLRTSTLP